MVLLYNGSESILWDFVNGEKYHINAWCGTEDVFSRVAQINFFWNDEHCFKGGKKKKEMAHGKPFCQNLESDITHSL